AGDRHGFDHRVAVGVLVELPRITGHRVGAVGGGVRAVHVGPLFDEFALVGDGHGVVGVAVPDAHRRPGPVMRARRAHEVTPGGGGEVLARVHAHEGLVQSGGAPVGDPRHDAAT